MKNILPADLTPFLDFVSHEAEAVESAMHEDLAEALRDNDPFLVEVIEYALFGGGKRIRPLLAILAARICGSRDTRIYRLAAGFEYLHVATLVHDDVIDNALERRGRLSVGQKYGMPVAILAGDWLHARSMFLVGRYGGRDSLEVFCRSTAGMVDGEFLQLRYVADCGVTEKQYFDVIHRKTALLIESTCEIGALFAGADRQQCQALAVYGHKLGKAFQVIDDLLDYQGNAQSTGKKTGNDFVEGKVTLPLIRTLACADEHNSKMITALFAGDRTKADAVVRIAKIIEEHGGFSSARETAESLVHDAVTALDIFSGNGDRESLSILRGLAGYVLNRDR
ncbi:MAG: polyprenyl synthetase family protein [Desulfobulbaceae bacterium]|nr:polyprenyl synthetase family protein [Desulfobulbaceae bacterium]